MTDPFDVLHIADNPLDPRAEFTADLRHTLAIALENTMTDIDTAQTNTAQSDTATKTGTATTTTREHQHDHSHLQTITPYISVRNAAAALAFYAEAFDAVEISRLVGDDGRIGHAEILIGSSKLMLADEYPEIDSVGPETRGGPTCSFTIEVPDADASFDRAVAAGAIIERPVADQFHGNRMGWVRDPFGHRWTLSTPIASFDPDEFAKVSKEEGYELIEGHQLKKHADGDLFYFTLAVHDLARAQAFFGAVLGWQFAEPQPDGTHQGHIANISAPPGGIAQVEPGGNTRAQLYFVVDDIHAAVVKVRELGGTAEAPVLFDSGWSTNCVDDQGTTFHLSVPAAKYRL